MKRPKSSSTHTYSLGSLPYLFLFVGAKILKRYAKTRHRLEKFLTATPQLLVFYLLPSLNLKCNPQLCIAGDY
jgi:hypothetical protein